MSVGEMPIGLLAITWLAFRTTLEPVLDMDLYVKMTSPDLQRNFRLLSS